MNQIELHPAFQNSEVRAYGESHGIATEAWSPLAQGQILDDPVITSVAREVGRTPAQVVLRWHIQRGTIVFPKSSGASRMRENFELFDFELEPDAVARIDALDRGEEGRDGPHPRTSTGPRDFIPDDARLRREPVNERPRRRATGDRGERPAARAGLRHA